MKIGIDARLYKQTGIGRYIRNIIQGLGETDRDNEYVLYLGADAYDEYVLPGPRWHKKLVSVKWHSLKEQIILPFIFSRDRLDLLHVPYFNVPVFYPGKYVITLHDLTILSMATGRASTLPWFLYALKIAGYHIVLRLSLWRAVRIITVSGAVKSDVLSHFPWVKGKTDVVYEGVDPVFSDQQDRRDISPVSDPYYLYVGNAYPHKNIDTLLKAFAQVHAKNSTIKLVIIGPDDFFRERIRNRVQEEKLEESVIMPGSVPDKTLRSYYSHAISLVFVSFSEGFGLPIVEALACGCPVIASDIPVFHEIAGSNAVFVDPHDSGSVAKAMLDIKKNSSVAVHAEKSGRDYVKKFTWENAARTTLVIYGKSI